MGFFSALSGVSGGSGVPFVGDGKSPFEGILGGDAAPSTALSEGNTSSVNVTIGATREPFKERFTEQALWLIGGYMIAKTLLKKRRSSS